MAEVRMGEKVGEVAGVLARRIRKDDSELVLEVGSYLGSFPKLRIDRLYKKLVIDRRMEA